MSARHFITSEAFRKAVEFAPDVDNRINSTNWVYTSLRRLYNGDAPKAGQYFERVMKGRVWIAWGFVGAEREPVQLGGVTNRAAVR